MDFETYYKQLQGNSGSSGGDDFESFYNGLKMDIGAKPDTRIKLSEEQQLNDSPIQGPPSPQPKMQDPGTADSIFRKQNQPLPGRDLPVVGPLLKGLDYIASNPVSQAIAEYTVPDAPYLNEPNAPNARQEFLQNSGQEAATGVSKFIGQTTSPFFVPGAGLGTGSTLRGAAEGLTSRIAPGLGQNVAREALIGGGVGFGSEYAQGQGDLTQAGINAAAGAALGGAFPLAGNLIGSANKAAGRALIGAEVNPSMGVAGQDMLKTIDNYKFDTPSMGEKFAESPNYNGYSLTSPIEGAPKQGYSDLGGEQFVKSFDRNLPENVAKRAESAKEVFMQSMQNKYDPNNLGVNVMSSLSRKERQTLKGLDDALGTTTEYPAPAVTKPQEAPRTTTQEAINPDEPRFVQTVQASDNTPQALKQAVSETPIVGARTSDVLNRQQAEKLIETHGQEGLYSKLVSKTFHLSPAESTAAQILAKQFANEGSKEGLSKSIALVSKSAREGREMGQAIQALSQWNKMDETGALLLGERQLNRGVRDTTEWKSLTTEQAAPIQEAAQRVGKAQETKNLAEEVLSIVTNKKPGEVLTEAEKATIKQFQSQVKDINEKAKGFLPKEKKAADVTIKEIGQIAPKERTRDQVVNFLDAKAEKARQRLAANHRVGFAAQSQGNPAIDYAIIGAAKLAKGVVKFTDFTESMIKEYGQGVKPMINEIYSRSVNMFRRENGLPTTEELDKVVNAAIKRNELTGEDAYRMKAWANEIAFMGEEFKVEATQDLQKALKGLGTSTLGQKVSTIQTAAQLLNPVTTGRNVLGNAAQIALEKINKVSAVPIDFALSKLTGNERTIQFFPQNQEKFWRNFMAGTKSGWEGVSPTGTLSSYDIHPEVFGDKNPLKYLTKLLGATLQGFDYATYRSAYGDVVATYAEQMGKAQGLTKEQIKKEMPGLIKNLDDRIHELADQAGLYATFQDETLLSQGAQMLKQGLNKITDKPAQLLVDKGVLPKSLSMEGFGLGDVVLKYARTPANLIMRGIDYSPIGVVRSVLELLPLLRKEGKFNQAEASRAISRTITGTLGLTGMGYVLADAGILSGSASMDKDVRSIQDQSGQGAYKVNWSALGRYIMGGFDKNAAKYQTGDRIMDYAWLQPAAISLAMGVNANKAVKDRKNGDDTAGWQLAGKAILGGLQTVLENPMVQGVSSVIDAGSDIVKKQDPTKLYNIGKGVPASFVPTLFNQARTATDNNQRETFDKSLMVEMGNLMMNKVPVLSQKLPISYDSLGKPRERIQDGQSGTVAQYLTAFFSPAKLTEYNVSPEAKLVLDLMNQSGDKNVLPRISSKYINVAQGKNQKDKKVDLTAEQYSQLQQKVGQMVESSLSKNAGFLSDPNHSLRSKVERVKSILTDTGKKARDDIGTTMGYKKKDIR